MRWAPILLEKIYQKDGIPCGLVPWGKDDRVTILQNLVDRTDLVTMGMDTSHGNFPFPNCGIYVQSARQFLIASKRLV